MDWRSVKFDWNRARAFLVTAEEGSLSAAARALGMAQPTLGRQVRALEDQLDVALFERVGQGLMLTPSGTELLEHVRAMGEAANRVSLAASGQSQSIEGMVRITTTEVAAAHILPPIIGRLRRAEPGIIIELIASDSVSDLRRREADIAIRGAQPTDPDLIARKLSDGVARLYASDAYFERKGYPSAPEDLSHHEFVGFDDNEAYIQGLASLGVIARTRNFPVLCASHLAQWELVKRGVGIGAMIALVGEAEPLVRPAAPFLPDFEFQVWIAAHRELNTSRRVRLVFDWLAEELTGLKA